MVETNAMTNLMASARTGPTTSLINGAATDLRKLVPGERAWRMDSLRADDDCFRTCGPVDISATCPAAVNAWHNHNHQIDNVGCITETVKLVLVDG